MQQGACIGIPPQAAQAEMELTSDEMLRLQLLASNGTRDESGVLQAVQDYTASSTKTSTGIAPVITDSMVFGTMTKARAEPLVIYVVSNGPGRGFTLVNKDSRLTPVLGYSDSGEYSGESNPGFEILMANIAAEQSYLRDSIAALAGDSISQSVQYKLGLISGPTKGADPEDRPPGPPPGVQWDRVELEVERTWHQTDYSAGPLLKTKWGQKYPFNDWMADGAPVGCTATALGQIMMYHKYPRKSPLNETPYYWDEYMPTTASWTPRAITNVTQLMRDLGAKQCLDIDYKWDKSGADHVNLPRTLEIFGYHGGSHGDYNASLLRNDILVNNRPVSVRGNSDKGGHSWVADGYQEQGYWQKTYTVFYYQGVQVWTISNSPSILSTSVITHHNFGWNGDQDGWYLQSFLGDKYKNMELILNIRPRF